MVISDSRWKLAGLFVGLCLSPAIGSGQHKAPAEQFAFFEQKIRPVLVEHCYKCHSAELAKGGKIKGGLQLDTRDGIRIGGDSGPAVVPGNPAKSLLLAALRHETVKMPPSGRLPDSVIADFAFWIESGAFDPRDQVSTNVGRAKSWDEVYAERLKWWSLQPLAKVAPPSVLAKNWPRNDLDYFILNKLEANQLAPLPAADRRTLARRLTFALTGLPPSLEQVEAFIGDREPNAYERFVDGLLASPHFGEHWARHWMDVVHYADTHGFEWDVPAKHAWRYRDYLVRAFNADLPFDRLILEQLAGDLLPPRIDRETGINEALLGPMALRLGERRHGDNAQVEGVTQESITNIIDTVSKGILGATVACAQCHDHKFDAVGQRDFYALAGIFMSTRWSVRSVDGVDPNEATLNELARLKVAIRAELTKRWTPDALRAKIAAADTKSLKVQGFPQSLLALLQRQRTAPITSREFMSERQRRIASNRANLSLLADFTREEGAAGWRWHGSGMTHGLVRDGEIVIAEEGPGALAQILPAGRWSHAWSQRLAGSLQSPLLDEAFDFSIGFAGGKQVAESFVIDQSFHSERMRFLNQPKVGWMPFKTGPFRTLEGSLDKRGRRVYLELATKSLNNYYPPRTGFGGMTEKDLLDERSWFGITRVYHHASGKGPVDELARFEPCFDGEADPTTALVNLLTGAVDRFGKNACLPDDAMLLDDALRLGWLNHNLDGTLAEIVKLYRTHEKQLQADRTIGAMAEWNEGCNQRLGIRGSYTELGDEIPRGNIRLLGGPANRKTPASSGRLELARSLASPTNPLTARVYVNRVWLHLFGEGLVRTPDDFGHLGEPPLHPELLDFLAQRFVAEGWSTKKLIRLLVTSATWQQGSRPLPRATTVDPENRLWHHIPVRRLEAEAIRDSILAVSGRLDHGLFGPPIHPYRTAEDAAKRLYKGPLDGNGRRSIYIKMTLMEPPRFLALFNQPLPLVTVGKRDVTNVPDQALALLNDPFVVAMAKLWGEGVGRDGSASAQERAMKMFARALGRPPAAEETARLMAILARLADLHGQLAVDGLLDQQAVWQDFAHALFNLKEFLYVS